MKEPEKPKDPEGMDAISEALRKKGERRSAVATDLEALEASLLAEIEAFDARAFTLGDDPEPKEVDAVEKVARSEPIPEIHPEMIDEPPKTKTIFTAPPAAPMPEPSLPASGKSSLLDQLRRQAATVQNDESAKRKDFEDQCRQFDGALRRIFSYCHDLVQQLNVLRPPVDREYAMLGGLRFAGLEWQKGFVDYRTRPDSAGTLYEFVTLACHLANPERLHQERDAVAAEHLRKTLLDHGVSYTYRDVMKERRTVEKVIFSIAAEIKINLRWQGDFDQRALLLECRNLERFGSLSYVIPLDAVKPAMLDEFGRFLLGQPNRFREYCGAPIASLSYRR